MKRFFKTMAFTLLGLLMSVNLMAMDATYTVGTTALSSVSAGDLVAWGTSNTSLAIRIASNWIYCGNTKADWIVFKVVAGTNGFYLQNVDNDTYIYSSAAKKVAFDETNKTLLTIVDNGDHKNIVSGGTIGYYTLNGTGIRPYSGTCYTDAHLYSVTGGTPTEKYTVTLKDNNTKLEEASAGAGVTLPSRTTTCTDYTFAGWSETNCATETTTAPTIIEAGAYKPSKNVDLYPVFKKTVSGGESTATSSNLSGTTTNAQTLEAGKPITYKISSENDYSNPLRVYKGKTLTIAGAKITQIVLSGNDTSNPISNLTLTSGGGSLSNGTWTKADGATSIVFTASSGQARVSTITVTYGGGSTIYYVATPQCASPKTHVTYDANGVTGSGTLPTDANEYESGASITISTSTLSHADYDFVGWNTDKDASTALTGTVTAAGEDITFYAIWKTKTLTSIAVSGTPTKIIYEVGEAFNPAGLTVTPTYSNNTTAPAIDFNTIEWSFDPETLSEGNTSCDVMASVDNVMSNVFTVTGLIVNAKSCIYEPKLALNDVLAKTTDDADFAMGIETENVGAGQTIVYNSSNTSVATVVNGKIHIVGIGTTNITASVEADDDYCSAVSDPCVLTVTNPQYEITWSVNGSETIDPSKVEKNSKVSALPSAPTVDGCEDDKVFVGWTANPIDGVGSKPDDLFNDVAGSPEITQNTIFYAVFADKGQGGAGPTITKSVNLSSTGWQNQSQHTSLTIENGIITATASNGTNTGKFYTNDHTWRFYAGESGTLTINAVSGYVLEGVTITWSPKDYGTLSYNNSSVTSGTEVAVSGQSAGFTVGSSSGSSGKALVSAISVKYHSTTGGAPTYSNYITSCDAPTPSIIFKDGEDVVEKLDFETDYNSTDISGTKTLKISGEHLYQYGKPYFSIVDEEENEVFSVTPTQGATYRQGTTTFSDNVEVRYDAIGAGTFNAELQVWDLDATQEQVVASIPLKLIVNPTYTVTLDNLTTGEISTTDNIVDIKAGTEVNLNFTPNSPTIVFQKWIVYDEKLEDIAESCISGNVLTMPAKNVTVSAETVTLPQLDKVEGLGEDNVTSHSAILSWTAVDNASSYSLHIIDDASFEETIPVSETSYEISGLVGNTIYYWTVKAIGDGSTHADGPDSEIADFTTTAPVLSSIAVTSNPTNLKYKIGDTFNPAGLKINTIYDDASEVEVVYNEGTKGDFSFTEIDFTKEGNTTVYVTYKGKTATETFEVIVVDKVMITWMVGDVPYCPATEATEDGKVGALPAGTPVSPCATHYPYFVGWTRYEYSGGVPDVPTLLSPTSTAEKSFTAHAIFAKTRTLSGFEKMGNDQFDPNALYAIGAKESGESGAAMHYLSTYSTTLTEESNESWGVTSTNVSDAVLFTLSGTASALKAENNGFYLTPLSTSRFKMYTAEVSVLLKNTGAIYNPATGSQYNLRYNHSGGNGGFRWYSGTVTNTTAAYFYKATYTYSNMIITCPPTYNATVANEIVGGSVQISLDGETWTNSITDQEKGTKIYLKNTPSDGYTFNKYVVTKDNEYHTAVTVSDNAFDISNANVNVSAKFNKIPVTNASIVVEGGDAAKTLSLGKTLNLSLDILPVEARPTIVWSSSDEGVVTVAATDATPWAGCVVTPIAEGSATVKAKVDNEDRSVTITVIAATVLDHLTLENVHTEYTLGDEFVKPKVTAYYVYEGGEPASHKVVTDDVVVTGYDKTTATMGDAKQTVIISYTDGVTVTKDYKVTVAPWKLNLVNRHKKGDATQTDETPIDVTNLGTPIDLTAHYATLCDEYQQIGYIKSDAEVSAKPADADLLTSYAPTSNNETLYGVYKKVGYEGGTFIEYALSAIPTGWTSYTTTADASSSSLRFGSGSYGGYISKTNDSWDFSHGVKVEFEIKRYSNDSQSETRGRVKIGDVTKYSQNSLSNSNFTKVSLEFEGTDAHDFLIGSVDAANRRCYIKNLKVYSEPEIEYTSVYDCRQPMDIIYNLNDGGTSEATCGATNTTALEGTSYTIFGTKPVWTGHEFLGWKVNDDAENLKAPSASIEINEATTLTAQWEEIVPENIVFNNSAITVDNGVTSSVTATITPTTAYLKTITWSQSSEDGGLLELAQTTSTTGEAFSFKALNPGTVTLTATAGTIERQVIVTINKVMALSQLEATNEHRTFKMGETFVKETITAIYSDGSQSERKAIDQASVNFSTPDMQTSGVKTIKVSYQDPNSLVSANMTYEITVAPWTLNVYSSPEKKQAIEVTTTKEATTIPACQAAEGNVFLGYSASLESTEVTVTNSYTPTADNENLYAVYQNGQYVLVTNVNQLIDGHKVVIAASGSDYGLGEQKASNRAAVTIEKGEGCITNLAKYSDAAYELTLGFDGTNYTFYDATNSGYLYINGSSNELLCGSKIKDNKDRWTIVVTDAGVATIANVYNSERKLKKNSNQNLFACYTTSQADVALYTSPLGMTRSHNNVIYVTSEMTIDASMAVTAPDVIIIPTGVATIVDEIALTNITIDNGGVATIENKLTMNNLTIKNGAKVTTYAALSVKDLIIETKMGAGTGKTNSSNKKGACGQLIIGDGGSVTASETAIVENQIDPTGEASYGWYTFSVPFPVDALNGIYDTKGNKLTNEYDYAIMDYHGDIRAQGQYGWKKYHGILQPGVMYAITVADTEFGTLRFKKTADGALVAANSWMASIYNADEETDANWNAIGNPNLAIAQFVNNSGAGTLQLYDHTTNAFTGYAKGSLNIVVGSGFFIQAVGEHPSITMKVEETDGRGYRAPAREVEQEEPFIAVQLLQGDAMSDQVFIHASDEATATYEIGRDVAKAFMSGEAKCAQLYVPAYGTKLCAADFQLNSNDEAIFPLTITAPTAGTYTLSVERAQEGATLYLMQNDAVIWNLSNADFDIDLTKGTNTEYSLLLMAAPKTTPTGWQEVRGAADATEKFIYREKLYLLRKGVLYDATGKKIK